MIVFTLSDIYNLIGIGVLILLFIIGGIVAFIKSKTKPDEKEILFDKIETYRDAFSLILDIEDLHLLFHRPITESDKTIEVSYYWHDLHEVMHIEYSDPEKCIDEVKTFYASVPSRILSKYDPKGEKNK